MTSLPAPPCASAKPSSQRAARKLAGRAGRLGLGLLAVLGLVACDDSQNILVAVQGLPSGNPSLGAYYSLVDAQPAVTRVAAITQDLNRFGFRLPPGLSGKLALSVFAYQNLLPCIAASGTATIELAGKSRQDVTITLTPSAGSACTINQGPTELPPVGKVPLAAWGNAPDNIWVVGDQGMILRWDGRVFHTIELPPELAAAPPTWRAVTGAGRDYVWVAGDKGAVARWNGTALTAVPLVNSVNMPFDLNSPQLPNWVGVAVANQATDDVFFAGHNNFIGHRYQTGINGVAAVALTSAFRAHVVGGGTASAVNPTPKIFYDASHETPHTAWKRHQSGDWLRSGKLAGASHRGCQLSPALTIPAGRDSRFGGAIAATAICSIRSATGAAAHAPACPADRRGPAWLQIVPR